MLYNVNIYNKLSDFEDKYSNSVVTFENIADTEVNGIVKLAMEYGKAVSVIPVEPVGESEVEAPECEKDYCDI